MVVRVITSEPPKVAQSSSRPSTNVWKPRARKRVSIADDVSVPTASAQDSAAVPEIRPTIFGIWFGRQGYDVTTDAVIALAGATSGDPGMICIAGTGSIAYGRNAARKFARVVVGDISSVMRAEDSTLRDRPCARSCGMKRDGVRIRRCIMRSCRRPGSADANDLLHRFYTTEFSRPAIAALSKLVDAAANDGDAVARNIIVNAAQQLATALSAVRIQIFAHGEPAKAPISAAYLRVKCFVSAFGCWLNWRTAIR